MPYPFDQWHDWLRSVNIMLSAVCCIALVRYWLRRRHVWTKGDHEGWFVWLVLSFGLLILSVDGIVEDLPFSIRTVIVFIMCLILTHGIYRKRKWIDV